MGEPLQGLPHKRRQQQCLVWTGPDRTGPGPDLTGPDRTGPDQIDVRARSDFPAATDAIDDDSDAPPCSAAATASEPVR